MVPVVALLVCFPSGLAAEEGGARWSTSLRWGVEVDDNPLRQEDYQGAADGMTRYLLGLSILSDLGPRGQASASVRHGGAIFLTEADASAALTEAHLQGGFRLTSRVSLQASADFKDRTEWLSIRDYQRGGLGLRAAYRLGDLSLWAGPAFRYYAFKPSPRSSNTGPAAALGATYDLRDDLRLMGSYSLARRSFQTTAWVVEDNRFRPHPDGSLRRDHFDGGRLTVAYQRSFSARLTYQYSHNRSNSFGQAMRRHGLRATATVPLPWELFASLRAEIQRTRYEDPVLIDDRFFLDEDNRNQLTTALARALGDHWELELRYNLYAQEFGIDGQYRRQTLGLSVGYARDHRTP